MAIAFFDLDRTLLDVNSGGLWVRSELRLGFITRWQAARAMVWLLRYHVGMSDIEIAFRKAIASLDGQSVASIRERTTQFYDAEVRDRVRPGAMAALTEHRARGDRCVLLTSSSNYLSSLVARDLGLDAYLCTRFETDADDAHTGRPIEPLCFGRGKLVHAERYLDVAGADWCDAVFYSDSASDLPVFEAAGRSVAVNPDPRLRRAARARGWPVVDWGPA